MASFNASLKTTGETKGLPATVELQEGRLSIRAGEAEIGDWSLEEIGLEPAPGGYKLAAEGEQILLEISDRERFAEELGPKPEESDKHKRRRFSRKKAKAESTPPTPKSERGLRRAEPDTPKRNDTSRIPASVTGRSESADPTVEPARAPDSETFAQAPDKDKEKEKGTSFFARLVAMLDSTIDAAERRWGPLLPNWVFNRIVFVGAFILVVLAFVYRGTTSIVLLIAGVLALMLGGASYTDDVMASKLLPGRATPTHMLVVGVGLLAVGIGFGLIA